MLPHSPSKKRQVVKRLFKEFNILPIEVNYQKTRPDKIASELVKMIEMFYQLHDISRMCPGRRDLVTAKTTDGEVKLKKRHFYFKLEETHAIFLSEHPEVKNSLSKFAVLRPPQVMLSPQTPTNVCTCIYHQNTILALDTLHTYMPNIPMYNKDFLSSCLESPDLENCWYNECKHTNCGFEYFYPFPNDDSINLSTKPAKRFKWEDVYGRTIKNKKSGTVLEFYTYTKTAVDAFLPHCFIKRKNSEQYELEAQKLKLEVEAQNENSNVMVLQMDYAEDYTCGAQDEVQSTHSNQAQVTLYTSVSWLRNQIIPYVNIIDTRQHNKSTVVTFTDQILSNTPDEVKHIKTWTDGPAS